MNWYFEVLRKYAVFDGRARRKEYWLFALFNVLISFVLGFIDGAAGLAAESGWGPLRGLYTLAVLIPSLAVSVRRLHDTNRSGWWLLMAVIPLIGPIVLLVPMAQDSEPGANQYGSNPKAEIMSGEEHQYCPICLVEVAPSPRYPRYICADCAGRAADEDGRTLKFYNESLSGGFIARYSDTGEDRDSHICFVDGVKCWADEAYFGGIVIQPAGDLVPRRGQ